MTDLGREKLDFQLKLFSSATCSTPDESFDSGSDSSTSSASDMEYTSEDERYKNL